MDTPEPAPLYKSRRISWLLFIIAAFILGALFGYYLGRKQLGSGLIPEGERNPTPPLEESK